MSTAVCLSNSQLSFKYFQKYIKNDVEEVWVVALNSHKNPLKTQCIFKGTVDCCILHPRDIFRFAYKENASGIIIAHNHPSQYPQPSKEDVLITKKLKKASYFLNLPLIDHIIISATTYFSFADNGWPKNYSSSSSIKIGL
ncbi:MAG: JAB domain-containing protein [Bdellovibrionaceae bacterium]|nr:JAB domain-containing protein [Pseudobdellovibrionaceae bacterium]